MKTGCKVTTAEEVLVAKGENLVANATDTVAMLSPVQKLIFLSSKESMYIWIHMQYLVINACSFLPPVQRGKVIYPGPHQVIPQAQIQGMRMMWNPSPTTKCKF